jgi:hypothetical protein
MAIGNTVFDTGSHQRQKPPRFPQSQHLNNSTPFHEPNLLYSSGIIALIQYITLIWFLMAVNQTVVWIS